MLNADFSVIFSILSGNGTASSSPSTGSSRNNSPRTLTEAKLRPGVTNRNIGHLQQRNSVNFTNSTLQEDLMKLINPDYNMTSSDDNFHNGVMQPIKMQQKNAPNSHSLGNIAALNNVLKPINVTTTDDIVLMRKKSRSREGINLGAHNAVISADMKLKNTVDSVSHKSNISPTSVNDSDLIITTARPATIISSTNAMQSMAKLDKSDEHILHIHEESPLNSPQKAQNNAKSMMPNQHIKKESFQFVPPRTLPVLPNAKDVDWSGLVDSAQSNEVLKKHYYEGVCIPPMTFANASISNSSDQLHGAPSPSYESFSSVSSSSSSSSGGGNGTRPNNIPNSNGQTTLPELQNKVSKLEHSVRRLTKENRRLQNESQAATQELRQFTEWYFQTIDRQT